MNQDRAVLLGVIALVIIFAIGINAVSNHEARNHALAMEAIKAGYVQKRSSGGALVWTKPNERTDTIVVEQ